jgi:5'-3' exonuclease
MYTQSMALVLEVLANLGFEPWGVNGFESDDMIGHAVQKYRGRFDSIYAASNDSDLFQLLNAPNFYIYAKDYLSCTSGKTLLRDAGLTPDQFMMMTAITGTHNDLAGIDRVGPVTAKKAIFDPSIMRALRDKHASIIDRNLKLIKLPHPQFPREITLPKKPHGFNSRDLYKSLGLYDIDVTNSMVQAFEQIT